MKLVITFEIPEGYEDIHPDLIVEDMQIDTCWKIVSVEIKEGT
jgi:hypothetical protein